MLKIYSLSPVRKSRYTSVGIRIRKASRIRSECFRANPITEAICLFCFILSAVQIHPTAAAPASSVRAAYRTFSNRWRFSSEEGNEETDGVIELAAPESPSWSAETGIYTITGVKVASVASHAVGETLSTLPRGIYVVNGRKVLVR